MVGSIFIRLCYSQTLFLRPGVKEIGDLRHNGKYVGRYKNVRPLRYIPCSSFPIWKKWISTAIPINEDGGRHLYP